MNDQTAAPDLEITASLAEEAEEMLRDFAEDAELDVALIVDHSGGLIAGITADESIQVETVGALVAGAVGSVKALGKSIGESNPVESINHGVDNTIYLRQLNSRFIIVGIAEAELPAGIIREKAAQIADSVLSLLTGEVITEAQEDQDVVLSEGGNEDVVESTSSDDAPFNLTDVSEDELEIEGEPEAELDEEVADEGGNAPAAEENQEEEDAQPPLMVDSPFEIAMDDEDEESLGEAAEEEEEGAFAAGEAYFELGGVESEEGEEDVTGSASPHLVEAEEDDTDDEEEFDEDAVSVPPLLIEPAMPTAAEVAKRLEDDATTSIAAISTPIATGITRKEETPPAAPVSEKDAAEDSEFEDTDEDDEPVGGPRYVFEIG